MLELHKKNFLFWRWSPLIADWGSVFQCRSPIVIQSRQVSKELHCFGYSSVKQRAVCIMNVWGYTEILPNFAKNLEMTTTTGWTARWILFYKSFGKITTKVFTRSVRVLYVVYSPTKVVLTWLNYSSTAWRSAHSLRRNNFTKIDINNVCVLIYIFRSTNHNINNGIDAFV